MGIRISFNKLWEINKKDSITLYNIARLTAFNGNTPEAWKWLQSALAAGFNFSFVLQYDPYFEKLRSNKRWNRLLVQYNISSNYLPGS